MTANSEVHVPRSVSNTMIGERRLSRPNPPLDVVASEEENTGSLTVSVPQRRRDVSMDVKELQVAHVHLSRRVAELSKELNVMPERVLSQRAMSRVSNANAAERTIQKLLLFATMNAEKVLGAPHPDLSRSVSLCPANTVNQIMLKSKSIRLHDS